MTVYSFALLDSILINSANTYIIPYVIAGLIGPSGQWGGEMWKMTKKLVRVFLIRWLGEFVLAVFQKNNKVKNEISRMYVCMDYQS